MLQRVVECHSVLQSVVVCCRYVVVCLQNPEAISNPNCQTGSVLQRVAACCSVLQRVAACCSVLHCVPDVLQCVSGVLQCVCRVKRG